MYKLLYLTKNIYGDIMKEFKPVRVYYEENINNYKLGKMLLNKYSDIEKYIIDNHNNIESLRKYENKDFNKLKTYLILGVRRSVTFKENAKVSDYLVSFTSSGCTASCLYCYLVCNYNKCSYLRIFVNREEMLNKIIKKSLSSDKELTFEIGSNSDLILENTITGNLKWTIEEFAKINRGYLTFPTKFHMVEELLNLKHNNRVIVRMSVNPEYIINRVEFGTSRLEDRIDAINKLCDAGYKVGILVAPVILTTDYKKLYYELLDNLKNKLSDKAKEEVFFEVILMTYSYVHSKINEEAFPKAIKIFDKEKMRGSARGKYRYKDNIANEAKEYMESIIKEKFPNNKIVYIV